MSAKGDDMMKKLSNLPRRTRECIGIAVLLVSFELDEIMSLSDRIDVIFDGSINGSMLGSEADENKLGLMMAGGKAE